MQTQINDSQVTKSEGGRGGHVIGHTKTGKPVYARRGPEHAKYGGFTREDHLDAAKAHEIEAGDVGRQERDRALDRGRAPGKFMSRAGATRRAQHDSLSFAHLRAADRLTKGRGEGSRGGKILGHTRSGKPIYSHDHAENATLHPKGVDGWLPRRQASKMVETAHPSYTAGDHVDAMEAHQAHYRSTGPGVHGMAIQRIVDAHGKAFDHLSRKETRPTKLEKADSHGEGSHGGHVIGHTRSGKPIYSLRHDMNHIKGGRLAIAASHHLIGYTPDDFADAAARHMEKFTQHREKMPRRAQRHLKLARHLAHTATEKGVEGDKMQMSGLHSSHGNHASLAAFHLREAEAKRSDDPAEALWHYGQVGLHSSAAIAARHQAVS